MVIKNPSSTLQILNVKVQFSEFNVSERLKDSVKLRRKKVSACFKKIKNQTHKNMRKFQLTKLDELERAGVGFCSRKRNGGN